jgi:D-3-phosphoglycerate dehydrogenase
MKKIAILGPIHKYGWEFLQKLQYVVFEITDFTKENLIKELSDVDGVILRTATLSADVMCECSNLKIVARHGVGYDNVDLNYLNENKIALAVTGTANSVSVAEHVMTMFLYLSKKINKSDALVKKGNFNQKTNLPNFFELYEKSVFILGFGRVGQAVAQRCLGFESKVYVYDPFVKKEFIENKHCHKVNFAEGLTLADFITIHMPLNNETKNLIGRDQFLKMKENCVLINTARGGIVNENDLLWALQNKKIYGAGLDVFEKEPPIKDHPLFELDSILLTPHNAALTLECRKRMSLESAENVEYFLQGKSELNVTNIVNRKNLNL